MSDTAIQVSGLGKQFTLGASKGPYKTFRETLTGLARAPFNRGGDGDGKNTTFWALRNVDFKVNRGEVVGIIGRNGAGKSTLLKILSRIVEPTEGEIQLHGRIGSLLEVGTGFHPELTGRENIYMNGAILGMRQAEIARKFDEIVAFSEVEKFLDTPVKRYSSGMYMKLAFAVAANLEPEILVVDEVLAVGDAAFQKKCLGKMNDVARGGRTVLFVSHNMAAIQQLTTSAVVLQKGSVRFQGSTGEAVRIYLEDGTENLGEMIDVEDGPRRFRDQPRTLKFTTFQLDHDAGTIPAASPLRFKVGIVAKETVSEIRFSGTIAKLDGTPVGGFFTIPMGRVTAGSRTTFELELADHRLAPGRYGISLSVGRGTHKTGFVDFDTLMDLAVFEVAPEAGEDDTMSEWNVNWGSIYFPSPRVTEVTAREVAAS